MGMSGSAGGGEETISRKADTAPRRRPNHPAVMGFSHSARSSSVRSVRRWIRILRSRSLLALSASVLIAGKNPVKFRPFLPRAPRARKVNPRKVNEVCSWSPRRLPSLQ
jgi:hypothetical protein